MKSGLFSICGPKAACLLYSRIKERYRERLAQIKIELSHAFLNKTAN